MYDMTDDAGQTLGRLLYQARKRAHLSQQAVGDWFELSHSAVSEWERDISKPEPDRLPILADRLGLDWLELELLAGHDPTPSEVKAKLDKIADTVDWLKNWAEGQS